MTKKIWVMVGLSAVALAAFACSSSSGGGGGAASSCFASAAGASQACQSCVESSCSSQLSSTNSACSDFLSCVCPGGTYNANNLQMCASKETSACQMAGSSVGSCEQQNCASQCASSSSSSSGGSSSSSGGSSSSSGGGMYTCSQLTTCCGMVPSAEQASCNMVAGMGNETACSDLYSGYKAAGQCP